MSELSQLQSEAKRLSKQVNQQILRLEREAKGDTIAIMHIRNKLDTKAVQGWTKSGRVRFNNKMNDDQLNAIITAMEQFKKEKTSTISGLKKELEKVRKQTGEKDFTYQDMFDYKIITTDLEGWITQHVQASKFHHITKWAKDKQRTEEQYIADIIRASEDLTNDDDTRARISRLYDKYVK